MTKKMLIDAAHPEEVRVALLGQNKKIEDFDFESAAKKPLRGNIFLARVTRVEPSLQAAFVDYGGNRHGFLAFSEIHPDYYQIPVADRKLLQEAEAEVAELAAQLELAQRGDEDDLDDEMDLEEDGEKKAHSTEAAHAEDHAEEEAEEEDASEETGDEDGDGDGDGDDEDPIVHRAQADEEEEEEDVKAEDGDDDEASDDDESTDDEPSSEDETGQPEMEKVDASANDDASHDDDEQPFVELDEAVSEPVDEEEEEEKASDAGDALEQEEVEQRRSRGNGRQSRSERDALFEKYKNAKRKRSQLIRNYKIQEVIKRRQILLVQVVKEERGNKGAALTTYMSLAGRYCVLMPNTARGGGISRKIAHAQDRRRLRRVVDSLEVPQGMGLIIRTAGAKRTKTEIKRDYDYLLRLWENIRTLTLKSIAPCLIYEEANLIKRAIRDLYDKDISKVLVEGEVGYREAKDFMKMLMPSHAKNVQPYKDRTPIFLKYGVEEQLDGMYQPTVRLKSGGYIVIHQTEALVAIDVNSGRSTRERNIEQTALRTNIEAAEEAARQFRLRDLAGLIVLDFIDMEEPRNNRKVEKALKDAMKNDRARVQVGRISPFGLLELSRQRRRSGIVDGTTRACPTCSGAGVIRSHEMAALRILRAIEGEALTGKAGILTVRTSMDVSLHVLNHNRDWLNRIEQNNGVKVEILADPDKAGDAYEIEKSGVPRERDPETFIRADQTDVIEMPVEEENDDEQQSASEDDSEEQRSGRKRRRRRRGRRDRPESESSETVEADADDTEQEEVAAKDGDDDERGDGKRKRRRRGRRGGRRNRRNPDQPDNETAEGHAAEGDAQEASSEEPAEATDDATEDDTPSERPRRRRSRGRSGPREEQPAEAKPEAASENVNGIEEAREEAPRNGGASEPETAAAPEPVQQPAEEAKSSAAQAEDKKSSRKGWWQRAMGS